MEQFSKTKTERIIPVDVVSKEAEANFLGLELTAILEQQYSHDLFIVPHLKLLFSQYNHTDDDFNSDKFSLLLKIVKKHFLAHFRDTLVSISLDYYFRTEQILDFTDEILDNMAIKAIRDIYIPVHNSIVLSALRNEVFTPPYMADKYAVPIPVISKEALLLWAKHSSSESSKADHENNNYS